jgi:hypothetical protein
MSHSFAPRLVVHECTETESSWYESVFKSFRTGRLERELQMIKLSATRWSCVAILWVSLVSFISITRCVASQRVFIFVSLYFIIDSVRKLLDTPSYFSCALHSPPAFLNSSNTKWNVRLTLTVEIHCTTVTLQKKPVSYFWSSTANIAKILH